MDVPATVELRTPAKLKPPVYVTARTSGASVRTRVRWVATRRWRGRMTFTIPGSWTLRGGGAVAYVQVQPPAASTFAPAGTFGCAPPSPANAATREALGSNGLWALFGGFADPRAAVVERIVGTDYKIVWRFAGTGDLTLTAIAPDGTSTPPAKLEPHAASSWQRPGDEWGSTFVFAQSGCWQIHAARADVSGDLWLLVRS